MCKPYETSYIKMISNKITNFIMKITARVLLYHLSHLGMVIDGRYILSNWMKLSLGPELCLSEINQAAARVVVRFNIKF